MSDVAMAVPTKAEIDSFVAPDILIGSKVLYYPHAILNSRTPSMGTVIWKGQNGRIITIQEVDFYGRTLIREAVRHVDDPKLRLNEDQREFGAWDFTPFDKADRDWKRQIEKHLKAIDIAFIGPTKSDRELLMFHAARLGLKGYSTKKNEVVREMISRAEAGLPPEEQPEGTDAE